MNFEKYEFYDIISDEDYDIASDFIDKFYYQGEVNFKLDYSSEHIKWLNTITEEMHNNLCYALVFRDSKIFVGFIMGTVVNFVLNEENIKMTEVNLLCVHPSLRQKNYGLYIINEFVRRVGMVGYCEAIYTGINKLNWPTQYISTAQYYHRPLDLDYLLNLNFTTCEPYKSIEEKKKKIYLPLVPKGLKELDEKNIDIAYNLLSEYVKKYKLYPIMSKNFFTKTFYKNNFVKCYLCYIGNEIKDIISYYTLPFKNIKSGQKIKAVTLYYYTNHSNNLYCWIKNLMIIARNQGNHLFNALDIMENKDIFDDLKFEEGTGILHYLIYKHQVKEIEAGQIGKILF